MARSRAQAEIKLPIEAGAVVEEFRKLEEEMEGSVIDPIPEAAQKIWKEVQKATKSLNAETLLISSSRMFAFTPSALASI